MRVSKANITVIFCTIILCAMGVYSLFFSDDEAIVDVPEVTQYKPKSPRKPSFKRTTRTKPQSDSFRIKEPREKPQLLMFDDEEEKMLNDFSRKILAELQAALDAENFSEVQRLVAKMLEIPPDPKFGADGVATILRRSAVEALGWFGAKGLPELAGLLADPDPEISQATIDQFNLALEDITLSDYEKADIISMAARVLKDLDGLEMMFMEINDMRHSVGAGLLVDICLNGTDVAKGLMKDQIEFFTGEDNIFTVQDIEKWLQNNPDGPDDDDLYGGLKDE